jgi:Zn-dependent metalloprotease
MHVIMENLKKHKVLRIRHSFRQPENTKKASKITLKVLKKVNEKEIINKSLENDLKLEGGDPREFLKETQKNQETRVNIKENVSGRSSIGTRTREMSKEKSERPSAEGSRREPLRKKITLKSALRDIVEDKILCMSQQKSLHRFDQTLEKWEKIEFGLIKKANKTRKMLITHRAQSLIDEFTSKEYSSDAVWYSTLRQNRIMKKFERFLPVGNELSGLYLREIVRADKGMHERGKSCPDLKVFGSSKLPMEIEAVKLSRLNLAPRQENEEKYVEEIIVENYDFLHRPYGHI